MISPLTAEEAHQRFLYCPETGKLLWRHNGQVAGTLVRQYRMNRYRRIPVGGYRVLAHRLIWLLQTGEWPSGLIDHINNDSTDNRWSNLRLATATENSRHQRKRSDQSSLKGIYKRRAGWVAQIQVNGKHIHLGQFKTPEDAHAAYCRAAAKFFGEFACHG